jgi:hypothetical protein
MSSVDDLVTIIHNSSDIANIIFGISGGGGSSLGYLVGQPGASNTIIEFNFPYSMDATLEYLKEDKIDKFASMETAHKLALTSYNRSNKFLEKKVKNDFDEYKILANAAGIGVTCALASKAWKRGDHRVYAVLITNYTEVTYELQLFKGTEDSPFRTRKQEDDICGILIVCIVAYQRNIMTFDEIIKFMISHGLSENDKLIINCKEKNIFQELLDEKITNLMCIPDEKGNFKLIPNIKLNLDRKVLMLPGSFNPLHDGHQSAITSTIEVIDPVLNPIGIYELSVFNVDKPKLDLAEIMKRLDNFTRQKIPIVLTNAPRFIDKSKMFPNVSFIIGIDTAIRLLDPKYTDNNIDIMIEILKKIEFYVLSRIFGIANIPVSYPVQLKADELFTYSMIEKYVPDIIKPNFKAVESKFPDVSSSKLR